jgi:hypothetical protein
LTEKTCSICGRKYIGKRSPNSVCCECRETPAYQRIFKEPKMSTKPCAICGKEYHGQTRTTTCKDCRKKVYQHRYYLSVTKPKRRRQAHAICRHE